jgi:hypothetical protein
VSAYGNEEGNEEIRCKEGARQVEGGTAGGAPLGCSEVRAARRSVVEARPTATTKAVTY